MVLGLSTGMDTQIQLSLPTQPDAGSAAHLEIVKQWLQYCDQHHQGCKRTPTWIIPNSLGAGKKLPTRVIAVNGVDDDRVQLLKPWQSEAMKDVLTCDKPRLGSKSHLSLGFPNGETHLHK